VSGAYTSDSERSSGEVVREFIERDGSIRLGLSRGLINSRALARYIQKETNERYSFEALLSAIRRYPLQHSAGKRLLVGKTMRKIWLKNNITVILLRNRPELQPVLAKFAGELDHSGGETFRMITTAKVVKVEIDTKNVEALTVKLQKGDVLDRRDNMAEILVETSDEARDVPGVLAALLTELAMNDVSIMETSSLEDLAKPSGKEQSRFISLDIYLVDEKQATRAYDALHRLSEAK